MKNEALSVTSSEKSISLAGVAGVELRPNALILTAEATTGTLEKVGAFLQSVEGSKAWWWGDYIIALRARKGVHYGAAEAAEVFGIEPQTLRAAVLVSEYYPPALRTSASWSHHYEAMAAGERDAALAVLTVAAEKGLSKTDLRGHIRESKITAVDRAPLPIASASSQASSAEPAVDGVSHQAVESSTQPEADLGLIDPGPVRLAISSLIDADRWAEERIKDGWEPELEIAQDILDKTENLRELLETLAAIAAKPAERAA
jgi:hypothetical protein